jgi:hypothetical protein
MTDDTGSTDKKDELSAELDQAERLGNMLREKGQELVEQGQLIGDIARAEQEFVARIPDDTYVPPDRWEREIRAWRGTNFTFGAAEERLRELPTVSSSVWTQATSASGFVAEKTLVKPLPPNVRIWIPATLKKFNDVVERLQPLETAERELLRLRLDIASPIEKSPVDLLKQAADAFVRPSSRETHPSAVLLPLRESINCTLSHLLRRRPNQEPAKNARSKVLSILRQAARPGTEPRVLERLGDEAEDLMDALSESKQHQMTREDIHSRLTTGALFLTAFLHLVDESKLKK